MLFACGEATRLLLLFLLSFLPLCAHSIPLPICSVSSISNAFPRKHSIRNDTFRAAARDVRQKEGKGRKNRKETRAPPARPRWRLSGFGRPWRRFGGVETSAHGLPMAAFRRIFGIFGGRVLNCDGWSFKFRFYNVLKRFDRFSFFLRVVTNKRVHPSTPLPYPDLEKFWCFCCC